MFAYFSIILTKSEDEESRVSEGRGSPHWSSVIDDTGQ